MRARVAIKSQWKDLLIDTFPSLTLGKLFTEDGRREISSLTTIFVAEGLPAHSLLRSAQLSLEAGLSSHQTSLTQKENFLLDNHPHSPALLRSITDTPISPITGLSWTFSFTSSENPTPDKNAQLDGQMKMGTLYLGNKGHYSYNVLSISLFVVVPVVCAHHITGKYDMGEYFLKDWHIVHLYSETYVNTF